MSPQPVRVWLVDLDEQIRAALLPLLHGEGMSVRVFDAPHGVLAGLREQSPDVLLADERAPGPSGFDLLARIHAIRPELPVIVTTALSDVSSAVTAYELGAFEHLPKPFDPRYAVESLKRAVTPRLRRRRPRTASTPEPQFHGLLGRAPVMQQLFRAISRLSRTSMTVLLRGEPGTGKGLVARALHDHSPRSGRTFAVLNPIAMPASQLAAELFGRETTGVPPLRGLFETLEGGCLYLEEIAELDAGLQARLLRVLTEGEIFRVGGQTPFKVNVRVIAGTRGELAERVRAGGFREDLYHCLSGMQITIPPVRERREDVPELLLHYLAQSGRALDVEPKIMDADMRRRLASYEWPGNVRELSNVCRRLTAMAPGNEITTDDLPLEIRHALGLVREEDAWVEPLERWSSGQLRTGDAPLLDAALPLFEKTLINVALRHAHGHRRETAQLLGWGRNTLTRKMQCLNVLEGGSFPGA